MSAARRPGVVAELGRPETPEESAARKAENSRKYRASKTVNNLWYSLLVTVGLVIAIVLIVPRGDGFERPDVDYRSVAAEAQGGVDVPLVVPSLDKGWSSNAAELRTGAADGVTSWYIGFLTPEDDYVGLSQGIEANPTWLAALLDESRVDRTVRIGGLTWDVYDNRDADDPGNVEYALATETLDGIVAVYGTASDEEVEELANAVATSVRSGEGAS